MNLPITKLYGFGSNGEGQLGVGHQDDLSTPRICHFVQPHSGDVHRNSEVLLDHVPDGGSIKKIVAGGNHTLILTNDGVVYACGNNTDGRCGIPAKRTSLTSFNEVDWARQRNVTDIAATWESTILVANGKELWACGIGSKGELGLGEGIHHLSAISKVFDVEEAADSGSSISSISASMNYIIFVLSNGEAYGYGSSRKGQLGGHNIVRKIVWQPEQLGLPWRAAYAVTARDFAIVRGNNQQYLQLGRNYLDESAAVGLDANGHIEEAAGWSTVYVLRAGQISGVGSGRRGQLPNPKFPAIETFAAGSEHCIALTKDLEVVVWGWGEHGNCGLPIDDRGNVVDRFNMIVIPSEGGERVAGVGAGCATSFIWTRSII